MSRDKLEQEVFAYCEDELDATPTPVQVLEIINLIESNLDSEK
jgi:hypothetical protein